MYKQYINERIKTIYTKTKKVLSCTLQHRIYCNNSDWKFFPEIGDVIILFDNEKNRFYIDTIENIHYSNYNGWVYDFEIEGYHNYFANDILCHNTCAAIGSIELIKNESSNSFNGALIFARGETLLDNFTTELVEKCTTGQYMPENYEKLTNLEKTHRINKKIKFYQMYTFIKFAKRIKKMSNSVIRNEYSNKIIVIDEIHNIRETEQDEDEKEIIETYKQFHRFLHIVENCKMIGMSGTPMKDNPQEIAAILNLFLDNKKQLPVGDNFLKYFMVQYKDSYIFRNEKIEEFKTYVKGMISFLRESQTNIEKKFQGKKYKNLNHLIVFPMIMSDFQTKYYTSAYNNDERDKKQSVYIDAREASLFIYPDGSYGKKGFTKFIDSIKRPSIIKNKMFNTYQLNSEFIKAIKGKTNQETLKNIEKHSISYANSIKEILNANGNCFVYSSLAQGSGAILFSLLLNLFGFEKANGNENEKGLRYSILTNKTASNTEIKQITNLFNSKKNAKGEYIKVIIGTKAISEGFSFKNVILEIINTPHWNYAETAQAIARGIRLGSHNDLFELGEKPVIRIFQNISVPNNENIPSIDLQMYKICEDKDFSIKSILRLLMESAIDCALNYIKNKRIGLDGSRECDYTICEYKCDGIDMKEVKNGVDSKNLDYSTYNIYYTNPKSNEILNKIENLFRENYKIDLDSIYKNLKTDFSEEEINNSIFLLKEQSDSNEYDYKTFLNYYSRTSVQKIINRIEYLFRTNFVLDYEKIIESLSEYTEYEIITSLREIINNNIVIKNKLGLNSYLREEKNTFFLVNNIITFPTFINNHYTKFPNIEVIENFKNIKDLVFKNNLPELINMIFSSDINDKKFSKLIKNVPDEIQEFLIQNSIISKIKNIKYNETQRDRILDYFKSYIKNINNIWFLNFSSEMKCLDEKDQNWKICSVEELQMLKEFEIKKEDEIKNNPYGIIGKYNPETNAFCIVDFKREEEMKYKIGEKRTGIEKDKRLNYSGKVCGAGGWKLNELIDIAVNRLEIPAPENFRKNQNIDTLIKDVKDNIDLISIFENIDLKTLNKDKLKSALYWGSTKKEGGSKGIKPLCSAIQKWLDENNLIEIDSKCGIQGKRKIEDEKEEKDIIEEKTIKQFRILEVVINKENKSDYDKQILKIAESCGFDDYEMKYDNKIWYMVYSKNKLLGFTNIENNILKNTCIYYTINYRKQNILKSSMCELILYLKNKLNLELKMYVDTRLKNYKKLIKIYEDIGFISIGNDERYTYMKHQC